MEVVAGQVAEAPAPAEDAVEEAPKKEKATGIFSKISSRFFGSKGVPDDEESKKDEDASAPAPSEDADVDSASPLATSALLGTSKVTPSPS
jgi:hypothetical protein